MDDTYKTIEKPGEGYFKDKGSKFISYAFPVQTEDEIKEHLVQLRKEHHSARHHCYAWRLGTEEITYRANDDGEPSSTAGKPILGQLQSFGVTNILIVVVRYFGGTLLGVSGLINAYKSAAASVLNQTQIITKTIERHYRLHFNYPALNDVMNIIKQENYSILKTDFALDCKLDFSVKKSEANKAEEIFNNYYGIEIKKLDENLLIK
jgi:uncharacterized YigZ family protein